MQTIFVSIPTEVDAGRFSPVLLLFSTGCCCSWDESSSSSRLNVSTFSGSFEVEGAGDGLDSLLGSFFGAGSGAQVPSL